MPKVFNFFCFYKFDPHPQVVTTVGGTIDDTELVDGIVFPQGCAKKAGGPIRMKDAKIALIQFCVSAPKTDLDNRCVLDLRLTHS